MIFFMVCWMGNNHRSVEGFLVPLSPVRSCIQGREPPRSAIDSSGRSLLRTTTTTTSVHMSSEKNDEERLRALGYSEDEIRRRGKKPPAAEELKVRVDLVEDVDPFSLTALGFALIAINFLVFANMGDGGIGGLVATIMNAMKE